MGSDNLYTRIDLNHEGLFESCLLVNGIVIGSLFGFGTCPNSHVLLRKNEDMDEDGEAHRTELLSNLITLDCASRYSL